MGYYTKYSLEIEYKDEDAETIERLNNTTIDQGYGKIGDLIRHGLDDCKWYEHDEDMRDVSKKFPNVLFILSGEGEESGDIWKAYYKNGKVQRVKAEIVFDEYNPKLLR